MGGEWVTDTDFGWIGNIFKERTTAKLKVALNQYVDYLLEHMLVVRIEDKTHRRYFSSKVPSGSWVASAVGEYPAVKTGALTEALADPANWRVEFENQVTATAFIALPDKVLDYADYYLEAEKIRPWANRALVETQAIIEETLGPKLATDIQEEMNRGITQFGARQARKGRDY